MRKYGFTLIELIAVITIVTVLAAVLMAILANARELGRRSSCKKNLWQMAIAFKMYAGESPTWMYPPPKFRTGDDCRVGFDFMWDGASLFPEYLTDLTLNICPSDSRAAADFKRGVWNCEGDPNNPICPCRISRGSYIYHAWAITQPVLELEQYPPGIYDIYREWVINQHTYFAPGQDPNASSIVDRSSAIAAGMSEDFINALTTMRTNVAVIAAANPSNIAASLAEVDRDLIVGGKTVYRVREGLGHFFTPPGECLHGGSGRWQGIIVVLYEDFHAGTAHFRHPTGGINTLFMDGHVEFVKYPGKFPAQRAWATLVKSF